jgi:hypothetical protein
MSESSRHILLVSNIVKWLHHTQATEDLCILVDEPTASAANKPPNIGGYQPDVFVKAFGRPLTIIGEAKTVRDLETRRSELQVIAYLNHLKTMENPCLVISTTWTMHRTAKGLLCQLRSAGGAAHVPLVFVTELAPVTC